MLCVVMKFTYFITSLFSILLSRFGIEPGTFRKSNKPSSLVYSEESLNNYRDGDDSLLIGYFI